MLRLLQRLTASDRAMRALGLVAGPFHPWHPDMRRDPYPTWRRLRESAPLVRVRLLGAWAAGRYVDVERILRDPCFSTDRSGVPMIGAMRRAVAGAPDLANLFDHNLLMIDGTRHARLRGLVSRAFTPRRVEQLRGRAEALVAELLERCAAGGEMDVVRDLARPLPATLIAELLGVPEGRREDFPRWSADLAELLDPLSGEDGIEPPKRATAAVAACFRELLAERRREPRDDLVSAMISGEAEGETPLDENELLALCSLLLAAGSETTVNLIGSAVVLLLRHPGERKRLQDDLALLPSAVEECLRFEPPVQLTDRAVVAPCEIGGVALRPGQIVAAVLAAANRDPERFPDPDRFDVARRGERPLSFGLGGHFCLGAALARLEAEIAIGALLRRFPDFSGDAEPPGWRRSAVLRGPTAVPIRLR
jgi:cytochrome P450